MKRQVVTSADESLDTLFQGRLAIIQRKRGYRFSLDAVLLAAFVQLHGREKIVDLGTGNGIIPVILASLYPSVRIIGLEIQEEMVERAGRSVTLNQLEGRVEIVQGDVCFVGEIFSAQSFDYAVCNPPYRRPRSGRINPDPERCIARHELRASLSDFLRAGAYLLRRRGGMALVYPAPRTLDLLQSMRDEGIEPKRLKLVYSFDGGPANLVLVEGVKGGRSEMKVLPPLVLYTKEKKYSPEMGAILSGRFKDPG